MNASRYKRLSYVISALVGVSAAAGYAGNVQAQGTLEEIVVVATKRSENLQDVPISITAHSASMLESAGIDNIEDLDVVTPGLLVGTQGLGQLPFIRGVGSNDGTPGQEIPIAVYVDGVYQPNIWTNNVPFNNVERIEVLKGPQGTLFGRNATGGLIHVITKEPTQEFEADIDVSLGNYDTSMAKVYVAGGVTENVAADVAMYYKNQDEGWGKNVYNGDEVSVTEDMALRSKWVIDASENTKITAIADYLSSEGNKGYNYRLVPGSVSIGALLGIPAPAGAYVATDGFHDINMDVTQDIDLETMSGALHIEHDFNGMTFKSLTSYQEAETITLFENDATPVPLVIADIDAATTDTFIQELQLSGESDGGFRWITGLFYMDMEGGFDNPKGIQLYGALIDPTLATGVNNIGVISTKSYAAFAEVTFDLSDTTRLTLGGRYSSDKRELNGRVELDTNPGGYNPILVLDDFSGRDLEETFSDPTYRVMLDHDLTEDVMVYGSFSHGFKSGNFATLNPNNPPFDPEELDAFEVGMKGRFLDNSLQVNGSVFYYDYTNLQVVANLGTTIETSNAAEASIQGLELDMTAALSDQMQVRVGYTYLDTEYEDYPEADCYFPFVDGAGNPIGGNAGSSCDATGNQLARSPENTLNLGLDYWVPVADGQLAFSATYYYNSGMYFTPEERLEVSSYDLLNGRITWTNASESFNVSLFGNNILDEEWITQMIAQAIADFQVAGAPRTYGVEFGFKF